MTVTYDEIKDTVKFNFSSTNVIFYGIENTTMYGILIENPNFLIKYGTNGVEYHIDSMKLFRYQSVYSIICE